MLQVRLILGFIVIGGLGATAYWLIHRQLESSFVESLIPAPDKVQAGIRNLFTDAPNGAGLDELVQGLYAREPRLMTVLVFNKEGGLIWAKNNTLPNTSDNQIGISLLLSTLDRTTLLVTEGTKIDATTGSTLAVHTFRVGATGTDAQVCRLYYSARTLALAQRRSLYYTIGIAGLFYCAFLFFTLRIGIRRHDPQDLPPPKPAPQPLPQEPVIMTIKQPAVPVELPPISPPKPRTARTVMPDAVPPPLPSERFKPAPTEKKRFLDSSE